MCLNTSKRMATIAVDCAPPCGWRNVGFREGPASRIDDRDSSPGHASLGRASHFAVPFLMRSLGQFSQTVSLPPALYANTKATYANGADRWRCIAVPHHPRPREGEYDGRNIL